jgi:MtN3 and saliva related transmembrane protein
MDSHSVTDGIGTAAAIIGTITFIPQVIKVAKQGGRDLSYLMLLFYWTAVVLWAIYGFFRHDIPLIAANLVIAVLVSVTAWLKWSFEHRLPHS